METNPYQSPQTESPPPEVAPSRQSDAPIIAAIIFGGGVQLVLFVLTALILDGGQINQLCILAIIGYWIAYVAIRIRRGSHPTRGDLLFLRYGVAVLFFLALIVAKLVYSIIGESTLCGWQRWFR
ncbi:MAG: hypothetical protein JXB10_06155 [Pirellulales bacterium]|nr:hypothetical protein [Pirellulales bacterium]